MTAFQPLGVALLLALLVLPVGLRGEEPAAKNNLDLAAQVDLLFTKWDRSDSPGCAVGIVQRGQLIYSKGFGSANLEYQAPSTPRTVFDIMSMTKTFTCACLAILMDEGKLAPEDELRKFVPEMHAFDPPIRIEHMIQCKSGLWDQTSITVLLGWENAPLQMPQRGSDFFALLSGQRTLQVQPGTEHRYSGGDYFLLGEVVKRITGKSLAEFAKERLFKPLSMARTFYELDPTAVVSERAVGHWKPTSADWHIWRPTAYWVGGGNLNTCVEDLARFEAAFSLGKLPRGKYLDELLTAGTLLGNRYCLDADAAIKLANPLAAEDAPPGQYRGLKRLQFTGGAWGTTSAMTRFPEQELTAICLTSNDEIKAWAINRQIADLLLADQLAPKPARPGQRPASEQQAINLSTKEMSRLVGHFRPRGAGGAAWRIDIGTSGLELTDHLGKTIPLRPLSATTLDPDGPYFYPTTRFLFSDAENPPGYTAEFDEPENRGQIVFERVELATPTTSELEAYSGHYESNELAATYRFTVREGALWLRIGSRRWEQLDATIKDEFIPHIREPADQRVITFEREGNGAIHGFKVDYYRVQGVRFQKVVR